MSFAPFSIYKVAGPLRGALVVGQKLKNVALYHYNIIGFFLDKGGGRLGFKALIFFSVLFCFVLKLKQLN